MDNPVGIRSWNGEVWCTMCCDASSAKDCIKIDYSELDGTEQCDNCEEFLICDAYKPWIRGCKDIDCPSWEFCQWTKKTEGDK
jgi:hypothetical protein